MPEQGTVGASGDLAPLAHLALGLMGEGHMWSPETGWGDAKYVSAGSKFHFTDKYPNICILGIGEPQPGPNKTGGKGRTRHDKRNSAGKWLLEYYLSETSWT